MKPLIGSIVLAVTTFVVPIEAHPSDDPALASTKSRAAPQASESGSTVTAQRGAPHRRAPSALFAGLDEASAIVPTRESPAAHVLPEADPGDKYTPHASRATRSNGLDQVVVRVDGLSSDRPVLSQLALPNLSAASSVELRQAFGQLLWKPSLGEEPKTEVTLLFRVER
jgi:hypothetical protein